ncbi:hypothetical protein [Trichodesmium erythraeum]|uniref:hypothetical protein n=1 Tax=Trichodesmium erythraeum TaxID=1206 RepID=UPI0012DCD7CD|nr:hypothetical protein [Trichodesmium erythraeum GBRTRLIN201]
MNKISTNICNVYQLLITYISVRLHLTLLEYHQQVLEVVGDETWQLSSSYDYKFLGSSR